MSDDKKITPPKVDPTTAELLRLKKRTDEALKNAAETTYNAGKIKRDLTEVKDFFNGVAQGGKWLYNTILRPVTHYVTWPLMKIGGRKYMELFNRVSHVKNEFGKSEFSKKRAGAMIAATVAGACSLVPVPNVPFSGEVGWSGVSALWWATTRKTETLYLHNSAGEAGKNKYTISGCSEFPCTDSDSVQFKVDDSWFHDARHFILHGTPFRPDAVAAAVPPVPNKCEVTYYGWRWRPISRTLDLWPRMLEASCVPINMNDGTVMETQGVRAAPPAKTPAAIPAPK